METVVIKQKKYELDDKESIKYGDVFFIDLQNLTAFAPLWWDNGEEYKNAEENVIGCTSCFNDIDHMLVIVKYIGNGIVEEMLTHEQIMMESNSYLTEEEKQKCNSLDFAANYNVYKDFETYEYVGENLSFNDYAKELLSIKDLVSKKSLTNSPLCWDDEQGLYEMTDSAKKAYLEYSKEEIIDTITKMKERAFVLGEKTIKLIDKLYNQSDSKKIDIAYLDNEIYDFEHKPIK